ncbi:MAG TPA: acetyltransferase [Verrucomicrobiae bacterium]|nr:acetyltransferase [Verrucomicrobiae bacterium]
MKQKVIVFGTGETADRSHFYLANDSAYEVCGFTVDRPYLDRATHRDLPVVAFDEIESVFPSSRYKMLVALSYVGVNSARAEKYAQAKAKGYGLITYVSSRAITWPGLVIGDNSRIHEGSIIQPFARIGSDVVIGPGTVIGHDTVIKDHCFLSGGIMVSGKVTIEPFCFIGAGAKIRDNITIASGCVIGAGAVVLEDTREKGVYRAHPATLFPRSSDALQRI